jgi:catechol 2,3-dioxygenase-like lactoylglutathione lyase family enzyme
MPASPQNAPRSQFIAQITYLVREYDEAIAFFTQKLGFSLVEDVDIGAGKRWVVVCPPNSEGTALLLARAVSAEQAAWVGNQAGGRVFLAMLANGIRFLESPRSEPYGTVAVFKDLYGNKWDLLEPAAPAK